MHNAHFASCDIIKPRIFIKEEKDIGSWIAIHTGGTDGNPGSGEILTVWGIAGLLSGPPAGFAGTWDVWSRCAGRQQKKTDGCRCFFVRRGAWSGDFFGKCPEKPIPALCFYGKPFGSGKCCGKRLGTIVCGKGLFRKAGGSRRAMAETCWELSPVRWLSWERLPPFGLVRPGKRGLLRQRSLLSKGGRAPGADG